MPNLFEGLTADQKKTLHDFAMMYDGRRFTEEEREWLDELINNYLDNVLKWQMGPA